MNIDEQKGYDWTKGALKCIAVYFFIGLALTWGLNLVRNGMGWGLDDSDRDGWNRSGLTIHTDAKTGVQYVSDGKGGLTKRESR